MVCETVFLFYDLGAVIVERDVYNDVHSVHILFYLRSYLLLGCLVELLARTIILAIY